jgi:hypothetical protein
MEENFDSELKITKMKMSIKSVSQKNTNCLISLNENADGCNLLLNSNLTELKIIEENYAVNKMLLVLIFLMVK